MKHWFPNFTRFEYCLWGSSVALIVLLFGLNTERDNLTLIASVIGVTALIFLAKANVIGQILTIIFSLFYAVISYRFQYYGEMITYLGMTAPIAAMSTIAWLRHPSDKGANEVEIAPLTLKKTRYLVTLSIIVTVIFYFILKYFKTNHLAISTLSITTSFLASALTLLRSHFYALAYAANDVVLIVLWLLASIADIRFLPMILCFIIFLFNDCYGFINWRKLQKEQHDMAHHSSQSSTL